MKREEEMELIRSEFMALKRVLIHSVSSLANKRGSQMYTVSKKDFEANNYAVVIWCKRFNVVFGAAVLK